MWRSVPKDTTLFSQVPHVRHKLVKNERVKEESYSSDEAAAGEMDELYESTESTEQEGSGDSESLSWISWFCSLSGHDYFCEIPEDYIEDEFNLTGISAMVPFYKEALHMIMDWEIEDDGMIAETDIEASAELLYGLIHQRYLLTKHGQNAVFDKYENDVYGFCPRLLCHRSPLIPCGTSDTPGVDTVRLYCSSCRDLYSPVSMRHISIDGAYFGTTFPHLFFMTFPDLEINENEYTPQIYKPRMFGFKINLKSVAGPRMQWLRMRFDRTGREITIPKPERKAKEGRSDLFDDGQPKEQENSENRQTKSE